VSELTGTAKAAAFHGLATNRAVSPGERLELALQALDIYEAEAERMGPVIEAALAWRSMLDEMGSVEAYNRPVEVDLVVAIDALRENS
jgi:hypothetical protein